MQTIRLMAVAMVALAAAGCGGSAKTATEPKMTMPAVTGKTLDVAKSDIKRAGYTDKVEVLGGGTFGVVEESNWTVCEQLPAPNKLITASPRLEVDRTCPGDEPPRTTSRGNGMMTPVVPSTTSSAGSTAPPEKTPAATPMTGAEVTDAIRAYLSERAGAGVVYAKAVQDVTFSSGALIVTFNPANAGISNEVFLQTKLQNMAEFVAGPMAFDTDVGNRLAATVRTVSTKMVDGTDLGTVDVVQFRSMNGFDD